MESREEIRPRLELPWTATDRLAEFLGAAGIVLVIVTALIISRSALDRVPTHFGFDGKPDAWGSPALVLVLAGLALVVYVALSFVSRVPHLFNYPWPITADNAPRQYMLARRLVSTVKAFTAWLFAGIVIASWRVALGESAGLTPWFLVFVACFLALTLVLYVRAARRAR